jgi:type IV pilus assembly protein PilO
MAFNLTPRNQKLLVAILAAAFGLVGYYMYLWSPKNDELTTLAAHVDSLEAQNAKIKAELARGSVDALKAEAIRYQQNLTIMRQLVPTGNEVPALLEQVSTAARRSGLDLGDIQPQPVIPGEQFDTYSYKIGILGAYHDLGEFLTNVGALTRIVAPINVALTPSTNPQAAKGRVKSDEALLKADFEIRTYVAKVSAAPAPPKGGD